MNNIVHTGYIISSTEQDMKIVLTVKLIICANGIYSSVSVLTQEVELARGRDWILLFIKHYVIL